MVYGSTDNIQLRIDLMQRAGATQAEVEKYKKEHWIFKSVRRMAWEDAKEGGDLERAIEILQESRKIDQDDRYDVAAYTRQLINLYHETGKTEEEKEERYRAFIDGAGADIKQFRTLKGMCGTGEWSQKRSHIILATKDVKLRCAYLAEEGMIKQLYEEVAAEESVELLDQYAPLLREKYSEEILERYKQLVVQLAEDARNRAAYRNLTGYLERMKRCNGGEQVIRELILGWMDQYSTRKVMMEELEKMLE